jgi:NitT/TauT family transport system permease protein
VSVAKAAPGPADGRELVVARPAVRKGRWPDWAISLACLAVLVGVWETAARSGLIAPLYLPAPTAILADLWAMIRSGELLVSLGLSLSRILWGFFVGSATGLVPGIAVGVFPLARAVVDPLLSLLYPVPKIALLPLIVLWLGIGEVSKVAIIAIGVFFPVCISTIAGVRETDPLLIRAARSFGATRWQVIRRVILKSALPVIFSGLRLGAGMALLLVVSAEMIAATAGLGFTILHAGDLMLTKRLMAGILVLSVLGLSSTWLLGRMERRLIRWRE